MIFPEIFDGMVMGFFTERDCGTDVQTISGQKIYIPRQEHSDKIVDIEDNLEEKAADAVFTRIHGLIIGVKTADCVPVLLFDPLQEVVGAVHAGWRGTAKGILRKSILHMREKYNSNPHDILVAIGPSIKACCYQVGPEVMQGIKEATGEGRYYQSNGERHSIDLQEANRLQAIAQDIIERNISITEECTCCLKDKFFSFRRDKTEQRQGGFICMP